MRNDFVHHVSYELRSPLTNIIGFIQLLGDAAPPARSTTSSANMPAMSRARLGALLAIIDDILDLASIDLDAMELQPEEVDIRETIDPRPHRACRTGWPNRTSISRSSRSDDIGTFRADAKRVRQILFNLLSNAIGFSRAGPDGDTGGAAARR